MLGCWERVGLLKSVAGRLLVDVIPAAARMVLWASDQGHVDELARDREFHMVHGVAKGVRLAPAAGIGARLYTMYYCKACGRVTPVGAAWAVLRKHLWCWSAHLPVGSIAAGAGVQVRSGSILVLGWAAG